MVSVRRLRPSALFFAAALACLLCVIASGPALAQPSSSPPDQGNPAWWQQAAMGLGLVLASAYSYISNQKTKQNVETAVSRRLKDAEDKVIRITSAARQKDRKRIRVIRTQRRKIRRLEGMVSSNGSRLDHVENGLSVLKQRGFAAGSDDEMPSWYNRPTVLVADDDPATANGLCRFLFSNNFNFLEALTVKSAVDQLANRPSWILVDIKMGSEDGLDIVRAAKDQCPDSKILIITGYGNPEKLAEAEALGVPILMKPVDPYGLLATLQTHPELR